MLQHLMFIDIRLIDKSVNNVFLVLLCSIVEHNERALACMILSDSVDLVFFRNKCVYPNAYRIYAV